MPAGASAGDGCCEGGREPPPPPPIDDAVPTPGCCGGAPPSGAGTEIMTCMPNAGGAPGPGGCPCGDDDAGAPPEAPASVCGVCGGWCVGGQSDPSSRTHPSTLDRSRPRSSAFDRNQQDRQVHRTARTFIGGNGGAPWPPPAGETGDCCSPAPPLSEVSMLSGSTYFSPGRRNDCSPPIKEERRAAHSTRSGETAREDGDVNNKLRLNDPPPCSPPSPSPGPLLLLRLLRARGRWLLRRFAALQKRPSRA